MQSCRQTAASQPHSCKQLQPITTPLRLKHLTHVHHRHNVIVLLHSAASGAAGFPSDADPSITAAGAPAEQPQQRKTIWQRIKYFFVGEKLCNRKSRKLSGTITAASPCFSPVTQQQSMQMHYGDKACCLSWSVAQIGHLGSAQQHAYVHVQEHT